MASGLQVLEKCLETAEPGGVIHLALCEDEKGLIMRWKTRLKAYVDPGDTQSLPQTVACRLCMLIMAECKQSRSKPGGQAPMVMQS